MGENKVLAKKLDREIEQLSKKLFIYSDLIDCFHDISEDKTKKMLDTKDIDDLESKEAIDLSFANKHNILTKHTRNHVECVLQMNKLEDYEEFKLLFTTVENAIMEIQSEIVKLED